MGATEALGIVAQLAIAGAIGAAVGAAELVGRYRDAPRKALTAAGAWIYVGVNALASAGALGLIHVFGWSFGATDPDAVAWTRILVAGFGAMALFRSSLFVAKIGDQDVGIGPSALLDVLLRASDASVDRVRATARAKQVGPVMEGVSFDKAQVALPAYCFALLQNVAPEDQSAVARQVAGLAGEARTSEKAKALILGLTLMNVAGEDVLRAAVAGLSEEIRSSGPS